MTEQQLKDEHDRWFARGQDARRQKLTPNETCLRNMRPGSRAYEAFADGYATPIKATPNAGGK